MEAPAAVAVVEALPVLAVVDSAHLVVLAPVAALRAHRVPLPLLARLPLLLRAPLLVQALAQVVAGLAHQVVEPAVALLLLLSRQSFSAAWARSSPSPAPPTYEPVPRSR